MVWGPEFILNMFFMIFCYLTNIVVVAFADELGELHGFLKNWQTWDDSCDPRFFVTTRVPKFLRYAYDKHYEEYEATTPELEEVGRTRWFTRFVEGGENFTIKERIQRYFCRFLWLTRNNGYGFAFWLFGKKINPKDMVWVKNIPDELIIGYDSTKSIWVRPWVIKAHKHLFGRIYLDVFLGWKIGPGDDHLKQCMIANRIVFSID